MINNHHWIADIILAGVLAGAATSAHAADEALLQVLLNNQFITQESAFKGL